MSAHITTKQTTTLNVDQSNHNWLVDIGGSIVVANGHGIVSNESFHDSVIVVSGDVVADATYKSGILSDGADAILQVDTMGSIHGYNGIAFYGEGTYAENLGKITAANIGIYANAVDGNVTNVGQINAKYGIYNDSPELNGTIVWNSGVITADYGVLATHNSSPFMNLVGGEVHAKSIGVSLGGDDSTDNNLLGNYGLIESSSIAIQGGVARDTIVNQGTIKGAIFLGGGDDSFDNRGGTIDHAVIGGAGDDTYIFGSSAFAIMDSSGTDTIGTEITRALADFPMIENLSLLGTKNINGTGNGLNNVLTGNSGVNTLSGGAGNDVLIGAAGADKLDGGGSIDTASYAGASVGVVANLVTVLANTGDAKGDTYASIENLIGSSYNDTLIGNAGANVLNGGTGADKMTGGGDGDRMTGGAGADTFVFKAVGESSRAWSGRDTIFDFSHSQGDKISLSAIDANTAISGDQAFVFKGTAAFSGTKGEVHFEKQASDTFVVADVNGDKVADFMVHFDDAISFQASDFLF